MITQKMGINMKNMDMSMITQYGHKHEKHGHTHDHGHHHGHAHAHDSDVSSVGIIREGNIDHEVMCLRLQHFLKKGGPKIYRMKGILAIEGQAQNFVLQGVHELWDLQPGAPWEDAATRKSKIIFIGKDLDRAAIKKEVEG